MIQIEELHQHLRKSTVTLSYSIFVRLKNSFLHVSSRSSKDFECKFETFNQNKRIDKEKTISRNGLSFDNQKRVDKIERLGEDKKIDEKEISKK